MQRGFISLENLYDKEKAQVQSLQLELEENSAEYEATVTALLDRLDKATAAIELLSAEVKTKDQDIAVLSTESHTRGAETAAVAGTNASVSRAGIVCP